MDADIRSASRERKGATMKVIEVPASFDLRDLRPVERPELPDPGPGQVLMRQYLAAHAPEVEVVELPEAHTTEYISREWKVLPAQVAKTLTLRIGEDAIIVVTCGDSRLDNRKVKEKLGGKGRMMPGSEASEITGHPAGAITPLCLASALPVFFDIGLKRFEEVVTAGGSTHAAIRIPLTRFAQLTGATWVDVCKEM
jgi:prolyl-tRNA editing enzyme YbaK/EbsC (Cys-tRNA(Pro) deacylase)